MPASYPRSPARLFLAERRRRGVWAWPEPSAAGARRPRGWWGLLRDRLACCSECPDGLLGGLKPIAAPGVGTLHAPVKARSGRPRSASPGRP